jgi:hypothetical protein
MNRNDYIDLLVMKFEEHTVNPQILFTYIEEQDERKIENFLLAYCKNVYGHFYEDKITILEAMEIIKDAVIKYASTEYIN